jgi:hypothetical protein
LTDGTGMSADEVRQFTSAMWRHAHLPSAGSLAQAPDIRRIIDQCQEAERTHDLRELIDRVDNLAPDRQRLFTAAVDEIQVDSKLWLIDELTSRYDLGNTTVTVLGAWYGVLPLLLNWRLAKPPGRMVCVDISAEACALGQTVVGSLYPNIEYHVADVMAMDYTKLARHPSSVLVNTICEHLADVRSWWSRIPAGQLTVMQSNNYERCPDHVNCVKDLDAMKAQTPLSELLYEGALKLPIFDRFMLIGRR